MPNIKLLLNTVGQAVKTPEQGEIFFSRIDHHTTRIEQKTKKAKETKDTPIQDNKQLDKLHLAVKEEESQALTDSQAMDVDKTSDKEKNFNPINRCARIRGGARQEIGETAKHIVATRAEQ